MARSLYDLSICMNTTSKLTSRTPRWRLYLIVLCVSQCAAFCWAFNSCAEREQASNARGSKVARTKSVKQLAFTSAGHSIRTEWLYTANSANAPTLIILPGSGGIEETGGFFRDMASSLSSCGINVVIVRYLDRSGLSYASSAQMGVNFGKWIQTVNEGVKFVQQQPGIDSKRVSIFGHSLGAQLALHTAATNPSVLCVVDMAGCFVLPTNKVTRMPPVLILHGSADRTVPLSRERQLIAVLKRVGGRYQEHIFKNADHAFASVSEAELFQIIARFLKETSPRN